MSYPTSGSPYPQSQPPYGNVPAQQPGYPSQPGYPQQPGYPPQPGYPSQPGYPQQPGYPRQAGYPQPGEPPAQERKNGFATAGLVLGILPTSIIGIVFSILGLVKAKRLGGVGKVRAWFGLVLAVAWSVGWGFIVVDATKDVVTCNQAVIRITALEKSLLADQSASNADAIESDVQAMADELNKDASSMTDPKTKTDMRKAAADFQQLVDDLKNGTEPPDQLIQRGATDTNAVADDCGAN